MELGVPPTATHEEVRRAFRRRARETHPDHQPDDPHAARRFTRLRAAYEEALKRIKYRSRGERTRSRGEPGDDTRRGKGLTEHELAMRARNLRDPWLLRRALERHGHRPLIGVALARNPALPTDALAALRRVTECHWTVDAAIAARADVPPDLLREIARLAREPVVGMAVLGNETCTGETLDALVQGPVRLDVPLENALAAHPELSVAAAARLAARYATNVSAVLRLIERGDLPEELVRRLAGQGTRPLVAAAAGNELQRRGLPLPPLRSPHRAGKPLTGRVR
jgi:DnaJ domain